MLLTHSEILLTTQKLENPTEIVVDYLDNLLTSTLDFSDKNQLRHFLFYLQFFANNGVVLST